MNIVMVPGSCETEYQKTGGSFCESCFARFLSRGADPNLACIVAVNDEATPETTLVLQFGEHQQAVLLTDEVRDDLAYGGWRGWKEYVAALPAE